MFLFEVGFTSFRIETIPEVPTHSFLPFFVSTLLVNPLPYASVHLLHAFSLLILLLIFATFFAALYSAWFFFRFFSVLCHCNGTFWKCDWCDSRIITTKWVDLSKGFTLKWSQPYVQRHSWFVLTTKKIQRFSVTVGNLNSGSSSFWHISIPILFSWNLVGIFTLPHTLLSSKRLNRKGGLTIESSSFP